MQGRLKERLDMHGLAPTTLSRPPTPNRVLGLTPIISKARHSANCRPRNTEQTRSRPALLGNRVVYGKERATYASFPRTPTPFFYADGGASRRHEYKTKKRSGTSSHKGLRIPTGRDKEKWRCGSWLASLLMSLQDIPTSDQR